jgi:hypothetical protein
VDDLEVSVGGALLEGRRFGAQRWSGGGFGGWGAGVEAGLALRAVYRHLQGAAPFPFFDERAPMAGRAVLSAGPGNPGDPESTASLAT